MVPHVLRYLFDHVDARRELLAAGLGIDTEAMNEETLAEAIIEEVAAVRDSLDVPPRLRDLASVRKADLPDIARTILADAGMANAPAELDPTADEIEAVLGEAW